MFSLVVLLSCSATIWLAGLPAGATSQDRREIDAILEKLDVCLDVRRVMHPRVPVNKAIEDALMYANEYCRMLDVDEGPSILPTEEPLIWDQTCFEQRVLEFGWKLSPGNSPLKYHAIGKALLRLLELVLSVWAGTDELPKSYELDETGSNSNRKFVTTNTTHTIQHNLDAKIKALCTKHPGCADVKSLGWPFNYSPPPPMTGDVEKSTPKKEGADGPQQQASSREQMRKGKIGVPKRDPSPTKTHSTKNSTPTGVSVPVRSPESPERTDEKLHDQVEGHTHAQASPPSPKGHEK